MGKAGDEKALLQQKSPAEFFKDNRNIAGFDNPGKAMYTTIRELVENSLDSAEAAGALPDISITVEEMTQARLNELMGFESHQRRDMELYRDYEAPPGEAKGKKRKAPAKDADRADGGASAGPSSQAAAAAGGSQKAAGGAAGDKAKGGDRSQMYYRITVRDNGLGMPHSDIPNMLGRVLTGTKYGVRQTRGKFGLGAKMALIWAKMSTGAPAEVYSAQLPSSARGQPGPGAGPASRSHYVLSIEIYKNEPLIEVAETVPNPDRWHGAELSLTLAGSWQSYGSKVMKYLRQIAVVTPYARFDFTYKPGRQGKEGQGFHMALERRTERVPRPPQTALHHPASTDLELLKRLLSITKAKRLDAFLFKDFDCVTRDLAGRIVAELKEDPDTDPKDLSKEGVLRLHQLLHSIKIPEPKGDHLSPAGEYNLRLGVMKEVRPNMVATYAGEPSALDGHAFVVEAAVSIGGKQMPPGLSVFRFANRIPLLFEMGSDVVTRTALTRINWPNYKIDPKNDRVGVFVSLVSTRIPFKGAGKEYVADDIDELRTAVKLAIQGCCQQLKTKLARLQAIEAAKNRKGTLVKYVPNVADAVFRVLEAMVKDGARGPKRRHLEAESGLVSRVSAGEVTEALLESKLEEHVDRMDAENALEYNLQQGQGEGAQKVYLVPKSAVNRYGGDLEGAGFIFRPLQSALDTAY